VIWEVKLDLNLRGKRALATGSFRGIERTIALSLGDFEVVFAIGIAIGSDGYSALIFR